MPLPADFLDELRARTPLPALVGRRVKLARSGRQWKGCCPFHGEKTPSFYVYDDHFHCFGCGAHGDAITFVMQSQGTGFPEAVEQLAAEAGLAVPQPSAETAAADRRRLELADVLARAAAAFERRLFLPEGARALAYLRGRGLGDDTIRRFGLGWSPGRGALAAELSRDGIGPDRLIEAGLMQAGQDGPARELFFERVMFPIRDRRGRAIGFGGRTLGDAQPKYLNGPETRLFSKRRSLYALDLAREGVRGGAELVVVEGYMDVIALHQAGFAGAVAPLGTALGIEQLELLWQLSDVPILCFDGDEAGRRAALRAAETALPLLSPARSLKFAALPEGEDPDTLVRARGAEAMRERLASARSCAEALFGFLRDQHPQDAPEQRAALRRSLEAAAERIGDRALAAEYRRALLDRFFAERRAAPRTGQRSRQQSPPQRAPMPRPRPPAAAAERQRILTAILLRHPALLAELREHYETLQLEPWLGRLRGALLAVADTAEMLDSAGLVTQLIRAGLEAEVRRVFATAPFPLPACALLQALPADAAAGWRYYYELLHGDRLDPEVAAARRELAEATNERTQQRLKALREEQERLRQGEPDGIGLPG